MFRQHWQTMLNKCCLNGPVPTGYTVGSKFRNVRKIRKRTYKTLFFHSSHSQREIHESYLCLPQIFVAYSCMPQIFAAYSVCLSHLSVLYLSHFIHLSTLHDSSQSMLHTAGNAEYATNICGKHKYAANICGIHEYDLCISL